MKRRRLELPRSNFHYPLKVARLPIPPPLQVFCYISSSAQNRTRTCTYKHTHLKRARLPIPPPGHFENRSLSTYTNISKKSGKRDSNSRPRPWQGRALPTELFPHYLSASIAVQRYALLLKSPNLCLYFLCFPTTEFLKPLTTNKKRRT